MYGFLIKKKSKIHGMGIFTEKDIKKNTTFYNVPTAIISKQPKSKWAHIGTNKWVSDEKILNYINHSCEPNSILKISDTPQLIAKKDIEKGEEITVEYDQTEKNGEKMPCNCQKNKCKKYFLRIE